MAIRELKECQHSPVPNLGYLAFHEDAERRMKEGQKQKRCPVCRLFIWEKDYYAQRT